MEKTYKGCIVKSLRALALLLVSIGVPLWAGEVQAGVSGITVPGFGSGAEACLVGLNPAGALAMGGYGSLLVTPSILTAGGGYTVGIRPHRAIALDSRLGLGAAVLAEDAGALYQLGVSLNFLGPANLVLSVHVDRVWNLKGLSLLPDQGLLVYGLGIRLRGGNLHGIPVLR